MTKNIMCENTPVNFQFFDSLTLTLTFRMIIKDKENLAIILVPLIMILSRGQTGQIKGLSLLGDYDFLTGAIKWSHGGIRYFLIKY